MDLDVGVVLQEEAFITKEYEQLWRDLFMGCISLFYYLFYTLEDKGWLNDSNHTDLLALHYMYSFLVSTVSLMSLAKHAATIIYA